MSFKCFECGEKIEPSTSVGVWVHDPDLGDPAYDLNEDHVARPEDPNVVHPREKIS